MRQGQHRAGRPTPHFTFTAFEESGSVRDAPPFTAFEESGSVRDAPPPEAPEGIDANSIREQ